MQQVARTRTRGHRAALAVVMSAAVTLGLVSAPGAAAAAGERSSVGSAQPAPAIAWTPCDGGFQCARFPVPVDHDEPSGESISLALIRLPATDPTHRAGSLFVNPGGPGGSGVAAVRDKGASYPAAVRQRYDLIGFDPRGIAGSTPLQCFESQADAEAATHRLPFPFTGQEQQDWEKQDRLLADACAAGGGPLLAHMSTANVARDLDLLRAAVGDARLNYLGYSYGSYLGLTYANMFPTTVGAFVIDGVLDPVAWSTGRGRQAQRLPFTNRVLSALGGEVTLSQFFTLCDRAADCAFSGGARQRYEALLIRLRERPVEFPGAPGIFVDDRFLVATTSGALFTTDAWSDFAEFLADLEAGAVAAAEAELAEVQEELDEEGADSGWAARYSAGEGMAAVTCEDTDNPADFRAWIRAGDASARPAPHFGRIWTWQSSNCLHWPVEDPDRYTGPWNARTSNPVLVVGNFFDPSTPYSGAVVASRLLPRSRLLSYAGWGHLAFLKAGNSCIDTAVTQYLVANTLPRPGTVCRPTGSPFDA